MYDDRVEEIDTDDDTQGVGLEQDYGDTRHFSDELRFTGIDMGGGSGVARRRRSGDFNDELTPSDDNDDYDPRSSLVPRQELQLMYKDKEDMLVERALERIARARALGKPNVKLSRAEIDALDRLERNQNPPRPSALPQTAAPKSKKEAPVKRKPVEVRKKPARNENKSASNSPKPKQLEGRDRGRSGTSTQSGRGDRDDTLMPYALPPPEQDYGYGYVDRRPPYPQGYLVPGPRQAQPFRQSSRTNSTQSLRQLQQLQQIQPMPAYQHPYYTNRYSSNPDVHYNQRPGSNSSRTSRPDPSEPDWEPRARSTSSLVNVPLDQLPYQTNTSRAPRFDPSDPRFASPGRRVISSPPLSQLSPSAYRRPQDELFLPEGQSDVMHYLVPSESEHDDDDDSDYDEGVQVNVSERPGGEYAIQTRSAAAASKGKNGARKTASGKGRRK